MISLLLLFVAQILIRGEFDQPGQPQAMPRPLYVQRPPNPERDNLDEGRKFERPLQATGIPQLPSVEPQDELNIDLKWQGTLDEGEAAGAGFFMTALPVIRFEPFYPTAAIRQRLEGYVDLIFDIDTQGRPFNIRIWRAEPADIFDESASEALLRWRYMPTQENGILQVSYDHTLRIQFLAPSIP